MSHVDYENDSCRYVICESYLEFKKNVLSFIFPFLVLGPMSHVDLKKMCMP